jgi:hypothetical protein
MKKIGKFCVLIAAALLVTSVVVALAQPGPAPYPTPPTPIEREPGVEVSSGKKIMCSDTYKAALWLLR